ncbi:kinesin-like protein KIF22 isoform X2 [Engraulis encrasicolus]|uniref:kinesin-like protein KIF22 isoform X1 n=1 Tax=Engraulis encrasicolus TaxID=184585 RepID=UPI002FD0B65A
MAQRVAGGESAGQKRSSRVRVAVRLRPYMDKEDNKGEGSCVRGLDSRKLEIVNWRNATETLQYEFDVFHGEQTTQKEVFVESVKPILKHLLTGQNASVFAYGPTGAGKTHTMLGSSEQPGVIPRAVREVFSLVRAQEAQQDGWEYAVSMSYLEIYQEKVLDLLCPSTQDLPIREDKDHNILIPGLTSIPMASFQDFHTHFLPASLNRTTASTKLNERSSRSHAILLIKVVRTRRGPPHRQQTGKLYLVDLAGSEDNRRTGNQGIRLKESSAINRSLFTLSKVVDALNSSPGVRVPYRDSKLTRLLQDSLGGSAHSVMVTNVAPEYRFYFDTFTALNFAAKSKQIVNQPFVRETLLQPALPVGKRPREQAGGSSSGEPQSKKAKETKETKTDTHTATTTQPDSPPDGMLGRLLALEKRLLGSPEKDLLKTVAHELEELRAKQKELEKKASMFNPSSSSSSALPKPKMEVSGQQQKKSAAPVAKVGPAPAVGNSGLREDTLFKSNVMPLSRKPSCARPKKQQAVVSPLQVSQVQPQPCAVECKPSLAPNKKKKKEHTEAFQGKENGGVDVSCDGEDGGCGGPDAEDWEAQLGPNILLASRQRILETLNAGSLKQLKDLQLIGDKKAKLIMGWREINGPFAQVEDLKKIEGITGKRFASFIKANVLSSMGK